jgi:hypothetical protein
MDVLAIGYPSRKVSHFKLWQNLQTSTFYDVTIEGIASRANCSPIELFMFEMLLLKAWCSRRTSNDQDSVAEDDQRATTVLHIVCGGRSYRYQYVEGKKLQTQEDSYLELRYIWHCQRIDGYERLTTALPLKGLQTNEDGMLPECREE